MSILTMIVAFGVACGVFSILVMLGFEALRKRFVDKQSEPYIPKTLAGGLGIGGMAGPGSLIARAGQNQPVRMSLNTVVMTPTRGLRVMSIGGTLLVLVAIWNPAMMAYDDGNLTMHIIVTALLAYAVLFISGYEARYNADGITAPNWLFQDKHYPWEEFISIKDDGHHLYRLRFESGKLALQKHLVGMPTFLTFVSEVREMNKRL